MNYFLIFLNIILGYHTYNRIRNLKTLVYLVDIFNKKEFRQSKAIEI